MLSLLRPALSDDATFCGVYRDARTIQRRSSSAVNIRLRFFISSLRGKKRGFSESEALFCNQGVVPGHRSYVLLLLGDIKGVLREIACFLRGRHARLRLNESELRVADVEAKGLLLLLLGDLALAVREHGAELVGFDDTVAEVDYEIDANLVLGSRVVEGVHEHAGEVGGQAGLALNRAETAIRVFGAGGARASVGAVQIKLRQQLAVNVLEALALDLGRITENRDFRAVLHGLIDQLGDGLRFVGIGTALEVERDNGDFVDGRVVGSGEIVLNQQLVVPQRGLGDGKVALAGGNRRLVFHDLQRRNVLQLQLFLVVDQGLIGVFQRPGLHLHVLISVDQIPIQVFGVGYGGDDLLLKGEIGGLHVSFGNVDVALVAGKAESVQQRLLKVDLESGVQFGIDCKIRAVVGGAEAGVVDLQVGAERKVLLVLRLDLDVVYLIEFDADLGNVRLRGDGVLHIAAEDEEGGERVNGRAGA